MSRRKSITPGALAVLGVVILAADGAWIARTRAAAVARAPASAPASAPAPAQTVAAGSATVDPTWCGKPLGARAVGLLKDPSACTKISLTGTAPTCVFWADCGELHFELDCSKPGPGLCRCDGEEGRTVPYSDALCTLDRSQPGAGLRALLDSASRACQWAPR
jgi:hypothetical protein